MEDRVKLGYSEGIVSVVINTVLFVIKYWAGVVSGSIALTADAWHTLSDSLSSILLIGGVKLSSKKPDEKHPFGYGRWEQITAIFISFLLAIVAYEFLKGSYLKFISGESANYGLIAVVVTIISIVSKEILAQYAFRIWRKTGNAAIKADAWHHRSDALSSVIVLIGILLKTYFWWIDSLLGVIISLMLFYAVYDIMKDTIHKLLGEEPSKELKEKILNLIQNKLQMDVSPHHFHIHHYGHHRELTFHIKLNGQLDLLEAHEIATMVEREILSAWQIETTIHIEPLSVSHS